MASLKSYKRLIVACDGTWINSDNGFVRKSWLPWNHEGTLATASNVTRICRSLLPKSEDGVQQIVYYQGGLGSQDSFWSFFFGGYLGAGISENIREAYAFLCNNYDEGDEIYLIGFSRGAFTARSIGGLISSVGLLTRHGLGAFYPIFKDWEHQNQPDFKPEYGTPSFPIEGRPRYNPGDPTYFNYLRERELTRPTIPPIKAIGVWDTVGSLGVPTVKLLGLTLHKDSTHEYSFVNTQVAHNVENAFQALALDDVRTPFQPTVWETPAADSGAILKTLKQTWFPGVHTSVGGGYKDSSISDITLAWMITQLSPFLSFDETYVPRQQKQNVQFYESRKPPVPVRSYGMGLIQRSDRGFLNTLTGRSERTPGEYYATDPETGKHTSKKLVKTHEFVHPCVRLRIEEKGQAVVETVEDYNSAKLYQPKALDGFVYLEGDEAVEKAGKEWKGYGVWWKKSTGTFIVEEKIENGSEQEVLVQAWPGVEAKLAS